MEDKLYIAKVGKSVGLKGESKLITDTDFLEQFSPGSRFQTKRGELVIEYYNPSRGLVKFENVSTQEAAKKLTNIELFSTIDATKEACHLENEEYFWFDIIGCEVFEDGELLGSVTSIDRLEPTDYLIIETDTALTEKGLVKSFLIPYVDRYIIATDIKTKHIDVNGALDILEAS